MITIYGEVIGYAALSVIVFFVTGSIIDLSTFVGSIAAMFIAGQYSNWK